MLLNEQIYWTDAITKILCTYKLKDFTEQLNELNMDYYGNTTMGSFSGTTADITLKNNHTWGCPVYVFDASL